MPFINKNVSLVELIANIRARLVRGGNDPAVIFFDSFLQDTLIQNLKTTLQLPSEWDGGVVNAGDFDVIYPLVAEILLESATRVSSESCPDIYKDASTVSFAFQEELNETFQCSGEESFKLIPIKSYSEQMIESGNAELLRGTNGEQFITVRQSN